MRGIIYLQLGQYQKAIQDFDESILVKPLYVVNRDDILVYYHRGIAYIKNGQYQLAIKDFSKIIYLNSDYGDAYSIRGAIYLNIKNQELGCLDAYKACNLGNCNLLRVAQSNGVCN
jgi:tetratricopeptide (TPR) repeat protein